MSSCHCSSSVLLLGMFVADVILAHLDVPVDTVDVVVWCDLFLLWLMLLLLQIMYPKVLENGGVYVCVSWSLVKMLLSHL